MTLHRRTAYRRTVLVPLLAAALLTITSCASTVAGAAQAATDVSTSSETSTTETEVTEPETTDPAAAPSDETAESHSPENTTTEPVPPVAPSADSDPDQSTTTTTSESNPESSDGTSELDAASVIWISTFCTGFADVFQYSAPGHAGAGKDETIKAAVDAYRSMADAADEASDELSKVAKPDFPGHEMVGPGLRDWLESVSAVYGQGSKTIAEGTYAKPSDLSDAIDKVEAQMNDANNDFGAAIGTIDPSVSQTIVSLPECQTLVNGAP